MDSGERSKAVLREVADTLDSAVGPEPGRGDAPGKFDDLVVISGKAGINTTIPALGGTHRGRIVGITLHQASEMKLIVKCGSPCRFLIVRNTLVSRLNILGGRRVHFSVPMIDAEYLARVSGPYDLAGFLQRSDAAAFIDFLRPFYSIRGKPGTLQVFSDVPVAGIKATDIIGKLERTIEFAGMLEDQFSDANAVLGMDEQCGREEESPE